MAARVSLLVALIVATLGGAVWLYQIDPYTSSPFGSCQLLERTGLYCPGCGGTRAMHEVLHLNLAKALALNPLIIVVIGLFFVLANVIAKELIGPTYPFPVVRIPAWLGWGLGGVVVLFGILRNVPVWPFSLLAP